MENVPDGHWDLISEKRRKSGNFLKSNIAGGMVTGDFAP